MSTEPLKRLDMTQALRDVAAFVYRATPERRIALLSWAKSTMAQCTPEQREAYEVAVEATDKAIDEALKRSTH